MAENTLTTAATITLGSWPDWIAAIFTSLAFVLAAGSYARSVRVRREAQARLVYSKITHVQEHEPLAQFARLPTVPNRRWRIYSPESSIDEPYLC
jgi:hypothetical protein